MLRVLLFVPLWIYHRLDELVTAISDDPLVRAAVEADLGLPPGTLANKDPKSWPNPTPEIRAYVTAANPSAEQLKVTFEALAKYFKFWSDIFAAAETEDGSIVADELLYRLLQTTTTDLIKFDYPTVYALMRLTGVIEQNTRLTLEEVFAPEVGANIFRREYWSGWLDRFEANYLRFRLEQQPDILPPTATPSVKDRQLGLRVFGLSDLGLGLIAYLASRFDDTDFYYGWEIVPRPPAPLGGTQPGRVIPMADHVASRTATVRVTRGGLQATLAQVLFEDPDGRLGWLVSLGGSFSAEQVFKPASRPIKVKATLETHGQDASAVLRFSGASSFQGAPGAGLELEIAPEATSNVLPPFAIPSPTGTRLEIGDFKLTGELNDEAARLRIELRRTALVIVTGDADPVTKKVLRESETRIDFELGLTIDTEHGAYLDGGSRLSTTIAVNKSVKGLRVQTVAIALAPRSAPEGAAELQLDTTTAFSLSLGPLKLTVDGIGATVALGTTKGEVPENAARLMGKFLYIGDVGFLPPKGIGIVVDGKVVTGGGYLFYDRDNNQYAGALQLSLGKRWTLTAIGLMTAGDAGFSLLVIASLEFVPAYPLFLGIQLNGIGLLVGINRTMDPEALRAGVRNKTLDAILFPTDVVANAARYVAALKTVFPPAPEHHLLGFTVSLGFGAKQVVRAELGVVYEFGAGRWAVVGQLHAAYPAAAAEKLLELHVDALGLWDPGRNEFSLDATLYDSHIGPVSFTGDVAVRMRKGDASFFLFSAGGYHPEFNVPAGFPALRRLTIALADSENLRLKLSGYVAITSNTRQIGARMELFVKIGSVSIEGILSFDALWQPDVRFVVLFDIEFKLKYKGTTFFGVEVSGRFTGPHPKRVVGKWSIDLWLFSIGGTIDHTFGADRPPAALPAVDPLPPLVAALKEPGNWSTDLAGAPTLVTLRRRDGVFVHPLARIGVRQTVVPLSIRIARFGGGTVAGAARYDITSATVGGRPATQTTLNEQFAAAEFLDLSDDEKLARPSFEAMPAGVSLGSGDVTFGSQTAVSEMDFDRRIDGAPPSGGTLSGTLATFAAAFGAAARSPLREPDTDGQSLAVGVERFVVASTDDLAPTTIGTGSFAAARQALDAHLATNPDARLQVVPTFVAS